MSKLLFMEHSGAFHGQMEKRVDTSSFYVLILGDIKVAIREGAVHEYEHLRTCIIEASKQYDISDREADLLLRVLDILKTEDPEARRKLMLELTPGLLSGDEHRQAEIEHQFRMANRKEHACLFLQLDARSQCAECFKSTQEGCTEICPARVQTLEQQSAQKAEAALA